MHLLPLQIQMKKQELKLSVKAFESLQSVMIFHCTSSRMPLKESKQILTSPSTIARGTCGEFVNTFFFFFLN